MGKPMRIDQIEVYSDATNAAVMRHPARVFPGVLVQGDTLHSLWFRMDGIIAQLHGTDEFYDAEYIRERLQDLLSHYKTVLIDHKIDLPFTDDPRLK